MKNVLMAMFGVALLAANGAWAQSNSQQPTEQNLPTGVIMSPTWPTNPSGIAKPSAAIRSQAPAGTPNPAYGWPTTSSGMADRGTAVTQNGPSYSTYDAAPATDAPRLQQRTVSPAEPSRGFYPDGEIVTHVQSAENELPEGTLVRTRLLQDIRSDKEFSGSAFTAYLTEDIVKDGRVMVPANSTVRGRIVQASSANLIRGGAKIYLRPDEIITPDGNHYMLHATVVATDGLSRTKTRGEGMIVDNPDKLRTAETIGLTTGVGAGAGVLIGGPAGLVAGASIGAAVGTVHWMAHKRSAELPKDSRLVFSLSEPMTIERVQYNSGYRSSAENTAPVRSQYPAGENQVQVPVATTPY